MRDISSLADALKHIYFQNNPDGQPATSFGDLDASKVPFYVIPLRFYQQQSSKIKPNALGVIIAMANSFMAYLVTKSESIGSKWFVVYRPDVICSGLSQRRHP